MLRAGELIVSVTFPIPLKAAYAKYKQPASRVAMVGVMVSQTAAGVRVAVTGARSAVFRVPELEQALSADFSAAAASSVTLPADDLNADIHCSAQYRAAMIVVMATRAVTAAQAR